MILYDFSVLCDYLYCGLTQKATQEFIELSAGLKEQNLFSLRDIQLLLLSLNSSIYHYIYAKEGVKLAQPYRQSAQAVSAFKSKHDLEKVGSEIIRLYAYNSDYLIERYNDDITKKAMRYIKNHIAEELSATDIAEHVGLSPNYFSNYFKQKTGACLSSYILTARIKAAKLLLANTSFSLEIISHQCGFSGPPYFCRCFKKVTRQTPVQYRKSCSICGTATAPSKAP